VLSSRTPIGIDFTGPICVSSVMSAEKYWDVRKVAIIGGGPGGTAAAKYAEILSILLILNIFFACLRIQIDVEHILPLRDRRAPAHRKDSLSILL